MSVSCFSLFPAQTRAVDGDARFADIAFADLQTDPVAALQRAYDQLGIPFGPDSEAAVRQWAHGHKPGMHGKHASRLEDFGLNRDDVRSNFGAYKKRFGTLLSRTEE